MKTNYFFFLQKLLLLSSIVFLVSCVNGDESCDDESNTNRQFFTYVVLPQAPFFHQCEAEWYPASQLYLGVSPIDVFSCSTNHESKWRIAFRLSGECYQNSEFKKYFSGGVSPGNPNGGLCNADPVYVSSVGVEEMELSQYIPENDFETWVLIDYWLSFGSPCQKDAPSPCYCLGAPDYAIGFVAMGSHENHISFSDDALSLIGDDFTGTFDCVPDCD